MPDLWPNILGGLTEALVGGIIGFLIAYYAFRSQRIRRVVEYRIFSMPLLRFRPTLGGPLQVTVSEAMLTGNEAAEGSFVAVSNAYGFEIEVGNVGNQPIENSTIEIQLDGQASIIEFWTSPLARPGFPISAKRDTKNLNVLQVSVPYINPENTVTVYITSVNNASRSCEVTVMAVGVQVRRRDIGTTFIQAFRPMYAPVFVLIVIALAMLLTNWLAHQLGYTTTKVKQIEEILPPPWAIWPYVLLVPVILVWIIYAMLKSLRRLTTLQI